MGRSLSHITLEAANMTQPNVAIIGEEVEARRMTLADVVNELADTVEVRVRRAHTVPTLPLHPVRSAH